MIEKVQNYIKFHHMIEKGDRIVVGVSGGVDSVALLLLLNQMKKEMKLELFAVHINHGIREEAAEDAGYVKQLCEDCKVPFYLFEEDIPVMAKKERMTEEEMGRKIRYQSFYQVMEQVRADKLAVAHHMGDQAETVLFHLIRGTDLSGMAGMQPVTEYFGAAEGKNATSYHIIRPLLGCHKKELTDWLVSQGVIWREDRTNTNNMYARNKIRNQVIPVLEEINQQTVCHVAAFADRIAEYQEFFQKTVQEYLLKEVVKAESGSGSCETDRFLLKSQEKVLAKAVIYEMLGMVCGARKDIFSEHVQAVYDLLDKQSGKKVMLPYRMMAENSYEKLIIRKCFVKEDDSSSWKQVIDLKELSNGEEKRICLPQGGYLVMQIKSMKDMEWDEGQKFLNDGRISKNIYTKFFDCDTIKDTLYIRTPEAEDYIIINEQGNRKKLSRYFIDEKIPVMNRNSKIVAANGHEILWIIGGRRCENYKISDNTKYILSLMYEGENHGISY
ncbi:MAG: tRNA lysidine(34) synthetase TilS [Lachnospiraceae bacterium]|nr:tRNA lysidine(34) synthetase TilS [Lachnospiraceae bacterium]